MVELSNNDAFSFSLNDIKQQTLSSYYREGRNLLRDISPEDVFKLDDKIVVEIDDGYEFHAVTLRAKKKKIKISCDCFFSYTGSCPHAAAALLYISKHLGDLKFEEQLRRDTIDYAISNISHEKLLDYFGTQLKRRPSQYKRFLKKFNLQNVQIPQNYTHIVDHLYVNTDDMIKGHVNFTRVFDAAHKARQDGSYSNAISALHAISDSVVNKADTVDDQDRYYTDCAIEAIDSMTDSILCQDLKPDQKQKHISSIFELAVKPTHKAYWQSYHEALQTICTEKEDLKYWEKLVESEITKRDGSDNKLTQLLRMQIYIFENDERVKDAVKILQDNYKIDLDMGLQFVRLLRHIDSTEARLAAKAVLAHYKNDIRLAEAALPIFEGSPKDYGDIIQHLFISTGDWKHFFTLKEVSDDWKGVLANMASTLMKSAPELAVDIYLKEKMYTDALGIIHSLQNPRFCSKYFLRLSKKFPAEYFEVYAETIRRFATSRIGKEHYQKVLEYLTQLRTIPNADVKFQTLIQAIRKDNATRPLLIRTLANL